VAFTYGGSPGTTPVDTVRFLVGDTDETEYFLQDEEISWLHETWISKGNEYFVASKAAEAIAAKLALQGVAEEQLVGGSSLYAGGMDAYKRYDPSVAPLSFGTGMHDNPEAGEQDYGDQSDLRWDWWRSGTGYNPS